MAIPSTFKENQIDLFQVDFKCLQSVNIRLVRVLSYFHSDFYIFIVLTFA